MTEPDLLHRLRDWIVPGHKRCILTEPESETEIAAIASGVAKPSTESGQAQGG